MKISLETIYEHIEELWKNPEFRTSYRKSSWIIFNHKCKNCKRELPNKEHITPRGCKYCDSKYHKKEKK